MNHHHTMPFCRLRSIAGLWAATGCALALLAGCGGSERLAIEGTVTLDGTPLPSGNIILTPQTDTASPTAGGPITDGKFSIAATGGVLPGRFSVEITSYRQSASKQKIRTINGDIFDYVGEQIIPARYSSQSELRAEVKPDGPNQFIFELTSP